MPAERGKTDAAGPTVADGCRRPVGLSDVSGVRVSGERREGEIMGILGMASWSKGGSPQGGCRGSFSSDQMEQHYVPGIFGPILGKERREAGGGRAGSLIHQRVVDLGEHAILDTSGRSTNLVLVHYGYGYDYDYDYDYR